MRSVSQSVETPGALSKTIFRLDGLFSFLEMLLPQLVYSNEDLMTFSIYKPIQIFFADLFLIHFLKYYYRVQQKIEDLFMKSRNRVIHD